MARARHAMRVHPLRSKGVVVGVPVAAAVAFGAHTVLGVTPLSDQHGTQAASSSTPQAGTSPTAGAPVQGYGLAPTPPPTTLGLLSAPATDHGSTAAGSTTAGSTAPGGSAASAVSAPSAAQHAEAAPQTVPIARPATPAPTIMTFTPAAPAPAAAAPVAPAAAPVESPAPAPEPAPAEDRGSSDTGSSGGSLLGLQLGGTHVSVLSFGS